MIDFDEEIKRFSPSLEVSQAEEDIYKDDLKDITDIVMQMTEDLRGSFTNGREKKLYLLRRTRKCKWLLQSLWTGAGLLMEGR